MTPVQAPASLVDLTAALTGVLHAVGEDVRAGRSPYLEHMQRGSTLAVALLDTIGTTVGALGSTPADTPEGIEVRRRVAEALAQLSVYQRVIEFARL